MSKILIITKPETLSEISRDIAQIFFATMVVESIVNKTFDLPIVLSGLLLSIIFWTVGLWLIRK